MAIREYLSCMARQRDFNPCLSQAVVDRAMARKPASARSEYLAEFREGLSAFLDGDWIDRAAVLEGELPPAPGISYSRSY